MLNRARVRVSTPPLPNSNYRIHSFSVSIEWLTVLVGRSHEQICKKYLQLKEERLEVLSKIISAD
jgi:hypothetical protein